MGKAWRVPPSGTVRLFVVGVILTRAAANAKQWKRDNKPALKDAALVQTVQTGEPGRGGAEEARAQQGTGFPHKDAASGFHEQRLEAFLFCAGRQSFFSVIKRHSVFLCFSNKTAFSQIQIVVASTQNLPGL